MRVTDAFLGEHGVFYAQFDHLEAVLDAGDAREVARLAALLASGLGSHADLEDELLFMPLAEGKGVDAGPVDVMLAEHREIEALLTAAAASGGAEDLRRAVALARDHFEKEEQAAFPLAERSLGEERLRELGATWAGRRGVRAG